MEQIIQNSGYQHITKKIFLTLSVRDLLACQLLNKSTKTILDNNPIFWIKKWILSGLSKNNQASWIKAIQLTKNNAKWSSNVLLYIKKVLQKGRFIDLPCFIDDSIVEKFSTLAEIENGLEIQKCFVEAVKQKEVGLIQILASKVKNPNMPKTFREIFSLCFSEEHIFPPTFTAQKEYLDVVQVLAPFIENADDRYDEKFENVLYSPFEKDLSTDIIPNIFLVLDT